MERKIFNTLLQWKKDRTKKPMLLYGPNSCGKTYSVLDFGKKEYKNTIYFECIENIELNYVLEKNNTVDKVIRGLSAISLETILQEESLIIFDNVTVNVLGKIKKLFLGNSLYHIIMITNQKNIFIDKKFDDIVIKSMQLVSFSEYLKYMGKEQLIDFIVDSFKTNVQMPFHTMAFEIYNDYILTGGYPEIITNAECKDINITNAHHQNNSNLQKGMLLLLDNLIDIKRGIEVYDNIFLQLSKDNKKFQYGLLKQGGRSKEYDNAINYMINNDIVLRSYKVEDITPPLSKHRDDDSFKLYYTNSGILFKKLGISYNKLLTDSHTLYLLYENDLATTLKNSGFNLYYHQSGGKSEIDFLIQARSGKIIPIEIVRKNMAKSKSLKLVMNKYELKEAIRVGEDNFMVKNGIKYIPFYAVFCLNEII